MDRLLLLLALAVLMTVMPVKLAVGLYNLEQETTCRC